jgi:hypothetical protein
LLTVPGIAPGNVDLIAPKGEVNAGEAGIRSVGNINIAALRVVGADNIQFGGTAAGVPAVQSSGLGAGLGSMGSSATAATNATASQALGAGTKGMGLVQTNFLPTLLTVEVIGLGDEEETSQKVKKTLSN